jgi:hypothetical protein
MDKSGMEPWELEYEMGTIGVIKKTRFLTVTESTDAPTVARDSIPERSSEPKVKSRASNYHRTKGRATRSKPLKPGSGR